MNSDFARRTTADKREIRNFPELPAATSFIRKLLKKQTKNLYRFILKSTNGARRLINGKPIEYLYLMMFCWNSCRN